MLNIENNKLDAASMWKILDAIEGSESIVEVHLDQKDEISNPKLIYKLCELFANNKTIERLYYSVTISGTIVFYPVPFID